MTADNIDAVNAAVLASTAAEADTLVKIQALVDPAIMTAAAKATALAKISAYAADDGNSAPILMDYTDAGVTGVTADNIDAVNAAVLASTAAEADTLVKIQALVDPAIMTAAAKATALAKISAYAADDGNPAPILMDYTDAGVTGVTADNIDTVNAAVLASTAAEADTLVKIQALVDPAIMTAAAKATALAKISAYAADDGNPAPILMDYTDAGVTGVTADNIDTVNAAVLASTAAEADTLVKIQALVDPAITVNDVAPSITISTDAVTATVGTAIADITIASSGGAVASYGIAPTLPEGLSFDENSGTISGTPTAVAEAIPYTITATNSGGEDDATVAITVNDVAPMISISPATVTATAGTAIADITIDSTGGMVASYSIEPAIGNGLSFDTSTGTISGTPTAVAI